MGAEPLLKLDETKELKKKKLNRKYAIIRFPGKLRKTDPDIISVGVHGDSLNLKLKMKRREYVPVPASVIGVLRDAKEPVTEDDDPSSPAVQMRKRKIVGFSPRFPFELLGWITKENYEKARSIAKQRSLTDDEVEEFLSE